MWHNHLSLQLLKLYWVIITQLPHSPPFHPLTCRSFSSPSSAHLGVSSTHLGGHLQRAIWGCSADGSTAAPPQSLCAFCLCCGSARAGQHSVSTRTCTPTVQYRYTVKCHGQHRYFSSWSYIPISFSLFLPGCYFCSFCSHSLWLRKCNQI